MQKKTAGVALETVGQFSARGVVIAHPSAHQEDCALWTVLTWPPPPASATFLDPRVMQTQAQTPLFPTEMVKNQARSCNWLTRAVEFGRTFPRRISTRG